MFLTGKIKRDTKFNDVVGKFVDQFAIQNRQYYKPDAGEGSQKELQSLPNLPYSTPFTVEKNQKPMLCIFRSILDVCKED